VVSQVERNRLPALLWQRRPHLRSHKNQFRSASSVMLCSFHMAPQRPQSANARYYKNHITLIIVLILLQALSSCGDYKPNSTLFPDKNTKGNYVIAGLFKSFKDGLVIGEDDSFQSIHAALELAFGPVFEWMNRDEGRFRVPNPDFGTGVEPYPTDLPPFLLAFKENRSIHVANTASPFFTGADVLQFCNDSRRGPAGEILHLGKKVLLSYISVSVYLTGLAVTREKLDRWKNFEAIWKSGRFNEQHDSTDSDSEDNNEEEEDEQQPVRKKLIAKMRKKDPKGKGKSRAIEPDSSEEDIFRDTAGDQGKQEDNTYDTDDDEMRATKQERAQTLALQARLRPRPTSSQSHWVDVSEVDSDSDVDMITADDVVGSTTVASGTSITVSDKALLKCRMYRICFT